jgi:P pilus assembly chaperone PapD
MKRLIPRAACALLYATVSLAPCAGAQEFSAAVSPPRFELAANAGERSRQVIEITNASSQPSTYHFRTADWTLDASASVHFTDELAVDSCRPWVAIERHELEVPAGGRYRFRFEVAPPAGTPARECRFAIMIEGDEQVARGADGLDLPVSGRIGVIVYVRVGDAAPDLQVVGAGVSEVDGRKLPVLQVNNLGSAHGRLAGFLQGTDASGRRLEFEPSTLPILPDETRTIALTASGQPETIVEIAFPVTIKGMLEWGSAQRLEINQLFESCAQAPDMSPAC